MSDRLYYIRASDEVKLTVNEEELSITVHEAKVV